MKEKKNLKRINPEFEYRLEQWGVWESSGNSLSFLGYKSWLGKLIDIKVGSSVKTFNEDDCALIHFAYLTLLKREVLPANAVYLYYASDKNAHQAAEAMEICRSTFRDKLIRGESMMEGMICVPKNKSGGIMRYRIKRVGKKYYPKVFVGITFLGRWWDINSYGLLLDGIHMLILGEDSEAEARENIKKHKAIEAENNDIEIIEAEG